MIGVSYDKFTYISGFTLSLLEDSGWYKVDWDYEQPYAFGKNKGCPFFNDDCINKTTKESKYPDFWCDTANKKTCTWDLKQLGTCLFYNPSGTIPDEYDYFSDQTGGTRNSQYCPFVDPTASQSYVYPLFFFVLLLCFVHLSRASNPPLTYEDFQIKTGL